MNIQSSHSSISKPLSKVEMMISETRFFNEDLKLGKPVINEIFTSGQFLMDFKS